MASVELVDLSKTFRGPKGELVEAVRHLSLTVGDGELVVLVGPSGCGKTSTLRMIAGLETVTQGAIRIGGKQVDHLPPKDRDVAMVFQNYALFPHLTVFENMAFGLKMRGVSKGERERQVHAVADLLGLRPLLGRRPAALSGGQRQRVAVGRAMVRHPKVFLLDEPLSNLDAPMRAQLRVELSRLHRRLEATMLYVTHDQVEAMTLGDRIVVMDHGVAQQVASPVELYERPANLFVAGFIGSPPMNFFQGRVTAGADGFRFQLQPPAEAGETALVQLDLPSSIAAGWTRRPSGPVVMGVRPEHCRLVRGGSAPVPGRSWSAVVELVETPGADLHLHVAGAGQRFLAKMALEKGWEVGQRVEVTLEAERASFFDPSDGRRLD